MLKVVFSFELLFYEASVYYLYGELIFDSLFAI